MSQELHYTSVPRGLRPGTRGFCTVAVTPQIPGPLVDRLEALSSYQPVFSLHDPSAALNPIVFSHLHLTVSGKAVSVLSRIGPAGLDYSARPNKYAHHVVLEGNERPVGGPAWLLTQPDFMQAVWDGEPREIPTGRIPPQGDRLPGVARTWQTLTGDAGWAGVLAEAFLADPKRLVFLVFRPGMDLLPLFLEATALLPASRRWEIDFSTYFSQLPQGVACSWRGVLEGSDEAKNARRLPNALFLDLCWPLGRAEGGSLVYLARTGEQLEQPAGVRVTPVEPERWSTRMERELSMPVSGSSGQTAAPRSSSNIGDYELLPELARLAARGPSGTEKANPSRRRRKRPGALVAVIAAACLVPLVAIGFLFGAQGLMKLLGFHSEISQKIATESERVSEAKKKVQVETAEKVAQSETARLKPEEHALTKVEPNRKAAETPFSVVPDPSDGMREPPKPQGPVILRPVAEKNKPMKSEVVFLELPAVQVSEFGGTSTKQSVEAFLPNGGDEIIPKYYMSDFDVKVLEPRGGLAVWTKSLSEYGAIPLARLKAKKGKLHFEWLEQAKQRKELAESLRDGILRIGADGENSYVLLRDPRISGLEAFDLANGPEKGRSRPLLPDDFKPRELSFPWANEQALKGTRWKLGIRGWKIVCRLVEPGPEIVIAQAQNQGTWLASVNDEFIPKEVRLKIFIDSPGSPHIIRVRFEFFQFEIIKRNKERRRIQEELQSLRKREKDLTEEDKKKLRHLIEQEPRIGEIYDKYTFLSKARYARLSLVVALKLDDSKILDIAKFRESAKPQP